MQIVTTIHNNIAKVTQIFFLAGGGGGGGRGEGESSSDQIPESP